MLVSGQSIYVGSSAITQVYQGADLIWSGGLVAPAWPDNYYYPDFGYVNSGRGLGYWKSHFNSGETAIFYFDSDDCEGEGGDKYFTYKSKTTGQTLNIYEGAPNYYITANTACDYLWLMPYSHYEAQNTSLPSFWSGCTALCWRQQEGSCGTSVSIPSGDYSNIELLVCLSSDYSYYEGFVDLVKKCPNLKYISNGTLTGSSSQYNHIVLTGSTSWTADSMKFTEWYCPGTTFIVQDNSYWRGIIDWDIAEERNVTFKDINGNIMAVNLERVTSLSEVTTADTYVLVGENNKKILGYDWNSGTFSHLSFSNYRGQSYYAESDFPSNYLTCKAVASGTGFTLYTATSGQTSKKISAARSGSTNYGYLVLGSGSVTPRLSGFTAAEEEDIGNIGYKATFPQVDDEWGFSNYMLYDTVYSFPANAFFAGGTSSNKSYYHLFRKK